MQSVISLRQTYSRAGIVKRGLLSFWFAIIAALPLPAPAAELFLNTVSAHFRPRDDQNNYNYGLGYLADTPCIRSEKFSNSIMSGVFHNTRYNPSAYIGCYFNLQEYRLLELGAMVGLVTGYERAIMPTGLLIATLHVSWQWNLRVSVAPVTGGVATLSVGYRF